MTITNPSKPESCAEELVANRWVPWPSDVATEYLKLGLWSGKSLDEILSDSAANFPERTAVVCGARRVTYRELESRVTGLAYGLLTLGINPGECIVVQMPNLLETIELLLAAFRAGIVPVVALPGHREADLESFCRQTNAAAYVTVDQWDGFDHRQLARRLVEASGVGLRKVVVLGEAQEFIALREVVQMASEGSPTVSCPQPSARDLALLQLSGGSTGTPKLIPRTHNDYYYSVRQSVEVCELTERTVLLVALPLTHNFPMSSPGFLGCLMAGGTVILCADSSPDEVFPLLVRERVTMTSAVPALALAWLQAKYARGASFPDLKLLQVGGAKLDRSQAESLLDGFGCQLQQVFGMAEGLVCYTPLRAPREEIIATQGRPMSAHDEVRIVDDGDQPVPEGATGHLQTRGPYTIRGYYNAADYNRTAFTSDGFYRTGDLVSRSVSGALVVEGRAKEQINRGGEKVAPAELEYHLASHPDVLAAAVVGVPDEVLGERICAFLVTERSRPPSRHSVLRHLEERGVAKFKVPDRIEFLDALPKTHVGKIDKKQLAAPSQGDLRSQESPVPPTRGATMEELTLEVATLMEIEPGELGPETNLLEWGLDSIRVMQLVESLKGRGAEVSFVDIAENPTLSGIFALLRPHPPTTREEGTSQ